MKTITLFAAVLIFLSSCSEDIQQNKHLLDEGIPALELAKGRKIQSFEIEDHSKINDSLTVYIKAKDSLGVSFRDTFSFSMTGDGFINLPF